jgi:hypothetical protein
MIAECGRRIADKNADKGWRMKRMVLMCIALAGLLYAGPLVALENDGPRIEIKEMRHDFGKVVQGTQAEYVFEIRNVGSAQLVIEKVQPS